MCGHVFTQLNTFNIHQRNCKKGRKRLAGALAKARELWSTRKRRRIDTTDADVPSPCGHTSAEAMSVDLAPSPLDQGDLDFNKCEVR